MPHLTRTSCRRAISAACSARILLLCFTGSWRERARDAGKSQVVRVNMHTRTDAAAACCGIHFTHRRRGGKSPKAALRCGRNRMRGGLGSSRSRGTGRARERHRSCSMQLLDVHRACTKQSQHVTARSS
jgi:hypothetical protein